MKRSPFRRKPREKPSPRDIKHMDLVAKVGCIVCRREGHGHIQPQIHHMKVNPLSGLHLGIGQRASHKHVLPLCHKHHGPGTGEGYHDSPGEWQHKHGSEIELYRHLCMILEAEFDYIAPDQE